MCFSFMRKWLDEFRSKHFGGNPWTSGEFEEFRQNVLDRNVPCKDLHSGTVRCNFWVSDKFKALIDEDEEGLADDEGGQNEETQRGPTEI